MKSFRFPSYELKYTAAVMLLAPSLRLFPSLSARLAGHCAWLSALAAFPVLVIYGAFLSAFMRGRGNGEGMAELMERFLGRRVGRAALIISAAWLLIYCAFILRAGADRLITTIYTGSTPTFFIIISGIAAFTAALGSARSIVRTAKIVLPFVFGILLLILAIALKSADITKLLPIRAGDLGSVLAGSLPAIDVSVCVMYAICFLEQNCDREEKGFAGYAALSLASAVLMALISAAVVGSFGAALTARLTRPFFSLVRNLVFFNTLERMEALVAALWIFPDLITAALFLYAAQHCLRLALGHDCDYEGQRITALSDGRYIIWFCAAAAISVSLLTAKDADSLSRWSEFVIPLINMCYAFVFLPIIYIVGKIRRA